MNLLRRVAATIGLLVLGVAVPAHAARLPKPAEHAALERAFKADRAHRSVKVLDFRVSSLSSRWAQVRYVKPAGLAGVAAGGKIIVVRQDYELTGPKPTAQPVSNAPKPERRDLDQDLHVLVVYQGSGSETYDQPPQSTTASGLCGDQDGTFTQEEHATAEFSWHIVYDVDLDKLPKLVGEPAAGGLQFVAYPYLSQAKDSRVDGTVTDDTNNTETCPDGTSTSSPSHCTQTYTVAPIPPGYRGGEVIFEGRGMRVDFFPLDVTPPCGPAGIALRWTEQNQVGVPIYLLGYGSPDENFLKPFKVTLRDNPDGVPETQTGADPPSTSTLRFEGTVQLQPALRRP